MVWRPSWLDGREESLWLRAGLLPVSGLGWAYGAGARLHRTAYERGWLRAARLPCRVVSVGSPTVGGSAKTPLAAWLAGALQHRGRRVVLASRGYGRRGHEAVTIVSDGRALQCSAAEAGDEPLLLAAHAPGVPVLVGARRDVVGRRAIAAFGAEVIVLDDGFHHHRLERDVDVLALDGRAGLGNGRVLPRGPLREPLATIRRAHALVTVDGPLPAADEERLARVAPGLQRVAAVRAPRSLRPLGGGAPRPPHALRGWDVGMFCGIARPASFRRTLESLGARVVTERTFPDHHRYAPRDLRALGGAHPVWVTTEKDAVKLDGSWLADAEVWVLGSGLHVPAADAFLGWLDDAIAMGSQPGSAR
jgi:tetraacyldisaccharide 4'-kinase